jgi:glycosyltransferase involved in cell wall biosynthesis
MTRRDSRLCLMGPYYRTGMSRVSQGLDVIVVPSVWHENSPGAVLEAFAHQVTVIASDTGGITELVHHGEDGLFFAPSNAGRSG